MAARDRLGAEVTKLAKRANQRLRNLEKAGVNNAAYRSAMRMLDDRTRFRERTKTMTFQELQHEESILREFLGYKGSTIRGDLNTRVKRYNKYQELGFQGEFGEFELIVARAFAEKIEMFFSSDVIRQAVTNGEVDLLEEIAEEMANELAQSDGLNPDQKVEELQGKALLRYLEGE